MGSMISKGSEEGGQKREKLPKLYVGARTQREVKKSERKAPKALRRSKGSEEGGQKGEKLLKLYVGADCRRTSCIPHNPLRTFCAFLHVLSLFACLRFGCVDQDSITAYMRLHAPTSSHTHAHPVTSTHTLLLQI